MRAFRVIGVAVAAALALGTTACVSTVTGSGAYAAGGPTPTGATPTDQPTSTSSTDPGNDPSTSSSTPSPTSTVDPVKTKEQVTCVLVQATVKNTNDKFNAAKTRDQQISILRSGRLGVRGNLDRSGLPHGDRIYSSGVGIYNELTKLVQQAQRGASPSTSPYNNATNRFRTACLSL